MKMVWHVGHTVLGNVNLKAIEKAYSLPVWVHQCTIQRASRMECFHLWTFQSLNTTTSCPGLLHPFFPRHNLLLPYIF